MALLWLVLKLEWVHLDQQVPPTRLDLDIVGCWDHQSQQLVGGISYPSITNPGSSIFPSVSISGIYFSSYSSSESTYWCYSSSSYELAPTPRVSTSLIIGLCLSMKVGIFGWLLHYMLT